MIFFFFSSNTQLQSSRKNQESPFPIIKSQTIRKYHLQSDIFHQKPSEENTKNKKDYYSSDIFHLKEEKNKKPQKTVKTNRCFLESGQEKEKPNSKRINVELYKETNEKEWNVKRMKPEKRKACEDNTLAYDLTNEKPKIEKTQKRIIKFPNKNKIERKGKKILVEKIKENPRNTLAYH